VISSGNLDQVSSPVREEIWALDKGFELTRRQWIQLCSAAAVAWNIPISALAKDETNPLLAEAIAKLEYLTPLNRAFILDKGQTGVIKLSPEKLREIRLVPETWSLDIVPDPASNSVLEQPFSQALGNAFTWDRLMQLAKTRAIRFMHVTNCTNGADPFHMSLWEGVPLREIIALAGPKDNVRRVYYQSYHKESSSPFQSSLALAQILETPPRDMPVILAYKMLLGMLLHIIKIHPGIDFQSHTRQHFQLLFNFRRRGRHCMRCKHIFE
jgi:hypothetical protein